VGKYNREEIRRLVIRDYTTTNSDPRDRRRVAIMPLVNHPHVDSVKLARIFLELARQDADKAA
jgi:hypothetical protein